MTPFNGTSDEMKAVAKYLRDNGLYTMVANTIHTNPPLTITEEQLADGFEIIDRALDFADQGVRGWRGRGRSRTDRRAWASRRQGGFDDLGPRSSAPSSAAARSERRARRSGGLAHPRSAIVVDVSSSGSGSSPRRQPCALRALPGFGYVRVPPFHRLRHRPRAAAHLGHRRCVWPPVQRNSDQSLGQFLFGAALYTWREALIGFVARRADRHRAGHVFVHSRLAERAFVPYVIASQTIPIVALAPLIVVRLGQGLASVVIIATYLTFFPVTIARSAACARRTRGRSS